MSSVVEDSRTEGVEFVREDDGSVTARDRETGLARGGRTRSEALAELAEVLALEGGEGEPIDDTDEFLRGLGIDPDETADDEPPWE